MYEYDNAEPQGMGLREIAESHVSSLLDKRDPEMVEEMSAYSVLWLDNDDIRPLLESLALLDSSKFHHMIGAIALLDEGTANALQKIGKYAEKSRAEFITEKAEEMLKEEAE